MDFPIRVSLPEATVYVSGTVNDVAVTWTNISGCDWQAIVDRASDETYRVELTIVDTFGRTTPASLTLYYGLLNLITDRTQADVSRVKVLSEKGWRNMTAAEKAEYSESLKGAYNATDLNRVGAAIEFVANRLFVAADISVAVDARQNWAKEDIPSPEEMEAYLADVVAIRSALATLPTTPTVPDDMENLTHIEANNIEQIMIDVDLLITNLLRTIVFCGQPICGQIWEEFQA